MPLLKRAATRAVTEQERYHNHFCDGTAVRAVFCDNPPWQWGKTTVEILAREQENEEFLCFWFLITYKA